MDLGYSDDHRKKMIDSGRKGGFTKTRISKITSIVAKEYKNKSKQLSILDFGAGYNATNVEKLKKLGFDNVIGYDLPENTQKWSDIFDEDALNKRWDIIMLSNVINVQPSLEVITRLITNLYSNNLNKGGVIIFNYPESPRYAEIEIEDLEYSLYDMTGQQPKLYPDKSTIVYTLTKV